MANQCCVCKCKLGFFDSAYKIVEDCDDYLLCEYCYEEMQGIKDAPSVEYYQKKRSHFNRLTQDPVTPRSIIAQFDAIDIAWKSKEAMRLEKVRAKEEKEKRFSENVAAMMLTTGNDFDGYRITKYVDVICEEVIFKNSFMNRLSAGFEDLGNALSFKETEMSGSSELIARARSYVKDKFRKKAAQIGANAVLGVEFESSIGSDIVRVAIFGTAVIIEKI